MPWLKLTKFYEVVPARYVLCIMCFLGLFNMMTLRSNLAISLVAMTGSQDEERNASKDCPFPDHSSKYVANTTTTPTHHLFSWNQKEQGLLISAYFIGFTVTQLLGGVLSNRFQAKWVTGLGVLGSGILTLLAPVAAESGYWVFFFTRLLTGFSSGVIITAMYALLGRWSLLNERGMMLAVAYAGTTLGAIISQFGSGYLVATLNENGEGWKYPFYVFGALACVWFVFWLLIISNSPKEHPSMSPKELNLLEQELGDRFKQEDVKIPWFAIAKSVPFWAFVSVNFSHNWGLDLFQMQLPNFFKNVLHVSIDVNGLYSSLPFILKTISAFVSGTISTFIQTRFNLDTNITRKIFTFIAYYGAGAVALGVGYQCSTVLNLSLLALTMFFFGFFSAGPNCTSVDMSPRFSGIILGLSNTISNVAGFVCPVVTGYMVTEERLEDWRQVFIIAGTLYLTTGTLFLAFGSSNLQPWADGLTQEQSQCRDKDQNEERQNGHERNGF